MNNKFVRKTNTIFGLIVFALFFIASCKPHDTNQKESALKEKELSLKERELALREKELAFQEKQLALKEGEPLQKDSISQKIITMPSAKDSIPKDTSPVNLVITPQKDVGGFGAVTFYKNSKMLFFYVLKTKKGKIIINDTKYMINKCLSGGTTSSGSYTLSGKDILITALNCKYSNEGGDCFHGNCPKVVVTLKGNSISIDNVTIMDCQSAGGDE